MGDDVPDFSDSMHFRASMITDIHIPHDLLPKDEKEGMLRHQGSMVVDDTMKDISDEIDKALKGKPGGPERTPSVAFHQGELETIRKVLEEVDRTAAKRMREGMQETNFAAGVLNSFLMAYVFGAFPQHFWLLYLVEGCYFLPRKFLYMIRAKPLNEAFYYFDLCWFLNFFAIFSLISFALNSAVNLPVEEEKRKELFVAAAGAACGPLVGATALLPFVAFLFHDVKTMTGLFIHLYPPMVMYTFLWHTDEIRETWPSVFALDYRSDVKFFPESGPFFLPFTGLGTIAGNSVALYMVWFILYVFWMLLIGLDLPRTVRRTKLRNGSPAPPKYDTVFHSTVRGGLCIVIGKTFWGRPKSVSLKQMEENDFEARDFAVYMGMHATMAILSIYVLAYPCFSSKTVHGTFLAFLVLITVHRGAKRYTYYSTTMYGRMIRKQFTEHAGEFGVKAKKKE